MQCWAGQQRHGMAILYRQLGLLSLMHLSFTSQSITSVYRALIMRLQTTHWGITEISQEPSPLFDIFNGTMELHVPKLNEHLVSTSGLVTHIYVVICPSENI